MFKSLVNLTKDVVDIATAPIEIALDVTRGITKPIAEEAKEVVDDIKKDLDVND